MLRSAVKVRVYFKFRATIKDGSFVEIRVHCRSKGPLQKLGSKVKVQVHCALSKFENNSPKSKRAWLKLGSNVKLRVNCRS